MCLFLRMLSMRKFRKSTSMRAEIECNEKLLIDLEWPKRRRVAKTTTLRAGSRLCEGRADCVEHGDGGAERQRTQERAARSRDLCAPYGRVSCGAGIVGLVSYLFPLWRSRSCGGSVSSGQKRCMSQVRGKKGHLQRVCKSQKKPSQSSKTNRTPKRTTTHRRSRTVGRLGDDEEEEDEEDGEEEEEIKPMRLVDCEKSWDSPPIQVKVRVDECVIRMEVYRHRCSCLTHVRIHLQKAVA